MNETRTGIFVFLSRGFQQLLMINFYQSRGVGPCETSMMELFCQRNDIFAKIAIIDNCQDPKYASTEDNRICKYCLDCRKTVSKVLA